MSKSTTDESTVFSIRLTPDAMKLFNKVAKATGISKAQLGRMWISEGIERAIQDPEALMRPQLEEISRTVEELRSLRAELAE